MYVFSYMPKGRNTLPYYDRFPLMVLEEDNLYNLKKEAVEFKREFTYRNGINETELEQFISAIISFQGSGVSMLEKDDRTKNRIS